MENAESTAVRSRRNDNAEALPSELRARRARRLAEKW